jgi:3-deoxy-D-manno-octulosonic acid kinase
MQERELLSQRGAILYDADMLRKSALAATDELFEPDYWRQVGALDLMPAGRGRIAFIRRSDGDWVLRHYQRGGLIAHVSDDRYLWWGAKRTRSFREWRLLAALRAWGLPVPAPVAARYQRIGLLYRADLITAAIPHEATLAKLLLDRRVPSDAWSRIGATLARFHARGVHHVDLNAHNILLDNACEVHVLDFDRGCIRARGGWEAAVLARLRRSIAKITGAAFPEDGWRLLLSAYSREAEQRS